MGLWNGSATLNDRITLIMILQNSYCPRGVALFSALVSKGVARPASGLSVGANVGDAKSLVIHPASTTHHRMDAAALKAAGISEGLVRLSIGLEDPDDLMEDLDRALKASQKG